MGEKWKDNKHHKKFHRLASLLHIYIHIIRAISTLVMYQSHSIPSLLFYSRDTFTLSTLHQASYISYETRNGRFFFFFLPLHPRLLSLSCSFKGKTHVRFGHEWSVHSPESGSEWRACSKETKRRSEMRNVKQSKGMESQDY